MARLMGCVQVLPEWRWQQEASCNSPKTEREKKAVDDGLFVFRTWAKGLGQYLTGEGLECPLCNFVHATHAADGTVFWGRIGSFPGPV